MTPVGNVGRAAQITFGLLCALLVPLGALAADLTPSPLPQSTATFWTVEDGLPGNAVSALLPARDGYLWVGSLNGLARFDGVRFVRFHLWDGLSSYQIQQLLQDRAGYIWLGTPDAGLMLHENGRFRTFARTNGLGGDRVRALAEDAEGGVWVAHNEGLTRWQSGRFVDMGLPREKSKPPGCFSVFCESNSVWALRDDWIMHVFRDGKWQPGPKLNKNGFRFDRVFGTQDGQLWSHTYPHGLARLEGEKWRWFGPETGLPKSYVTTLLDQGEDGLLCGTFDMGLFSFRADHATPAGLNEGSEMDGVLSIRPDNFGNLWVGTRSRGLLRLRNSQVQVVSGSDRARVARMTFDNRGRFWFGSAEELWFEQDGKLVQMPHPADMPTMRIAVLYPSPAGGIFICMAGKGLWEFDPDRHQSPVQVMDGKKDDLMGVLLAEDGAGGFWYGNESGMVGRLTGQTTNIVGQLAREKDHRVVSFLADSAGGVWARIEGTAMVRLNAQGKEIERVGLADGLPVNSIRCWLGDGRGGLWMGSPMGLYWWHKSRLLLFDARQGLPDDAVVNLVSDASGDLWCAAPTRLFRLRKKQLDDLAAQSSSALHPLIIGRSSGLSPLPFAPGIAARAVCAPDGRLLFPRIKDIVSINPLDFKRTEPPPKVLIEEVAADGRKLDAAISTGKPLRIPARAGEIAVRYTALESASPETVHFRYRFEGLDKNWSEAGNQRIATFRHLPAGKYRFQVSASTAGGDWSEPGATVDWEVEPFFWQTVWFRLAAALASIGLIASFVWKRFRAVEQRRVAQELFSRRLLESQETERRRIAAELHDGLGQNLVIVKNLAAMDQSPAPNGEPPPRNAEIAAAAERALDEVHAISYALRPPELDRLGLAKAVAGMVRRAAEASGIQFATQLEHDGELPAGADIQLFRIAQEAVNNLVKHSRAKTARVELWRDEGGVHLVVADDGRGLDGAERNGLGLSGMEERVRLLGGQLNLTSIPEKGTTVSILVPT